MRFILLLLIIPALLSCGVFEEGSDNQNLSDKTATSLERSLASASFDVDSLTQSSNGEVDKVLNRHKITDPKASEIKKLVQEREKNSAVREVKYATELSLPESKAVVDTLFHLIHGEPIGS